MIDKQYFKSKVFDIDSSNSFSQMALELFQYQYQYNEVYRKYVGYLGVNPDEVLKLEDIPFLPISTFKTQKVATGSFNHEVVFTSSGTSGRTTSKHYVQEVSLYDQSCSLGFKRFYGDVEDYCVLALLPSYLEREGSSLIRMVDRMIKVSKDSESSFYLHNHEELYKVLLKNIEGKKKTILIGVSFALLDFVERYKLPQNELIIMETGGMKGKRKEIIREELHSRLCKGFGVAQVHSEYGMTELLSQAYALSKGKFYCPPWMQVQIRQVDDALSRARTGKTGGINIIDLTNIDSCAFIETQDLGRKYDDGSFEVLGRFDNSDIRGCNLMVI